MIYEPFNPGHRRGIFRAETPHWFTYVADAAPAGAHRRPEANAPVPLLVRRRAPPAALSPRRRQDGPRRRVFAAHRLRGARPLVKDPIAVLAAPWLAREFDMQVVVMIRHPAAYAASLQRLNWTHDFSHFLDQPGLVDGLVPELRADIEEFARRPPDVVDQAALLWEVIYTVVDRYRAAHPDWLLVRHEDLSTAPAGGFQSMCSRLGIEYSAGVERFVAETTSASNPAEAGEGVVHSLRRHSAASVHTWHERLTAEEVARVRARTEETAAVFYADSDWSAPATT